MFRISISEDKSSLASRRTSHDRATRQSPPPPRAGTRSGRFTSRLKRSPAGERARWESVRHPRRSPTPLRRRALTPRSNAAAPAADSKGRWVPQRAALGSAQMISAMLAHSLKYLLQRLLRAARRPRNQLQEAALKNTSLGFRDAPLRSQVCRIACSSRGACASDRGSSRCSRATPRSKQHRRERLPIASVHSC